MRNNKQKNETQNKIIQSASELFARNGFQNTTIKQIAINAGFRHTVLYYYFKNKYEIGQIIYYLELEKIAEESYKNVHEQNLSIYGKLISQAYNIHSSILANPLVNTLFFEQKDYKNCRRESLENIVHNFIEHNKLILNFNDLNLDKEQILAAILIWESSSKSILSHIIKETLNMCKSDGILLLIKNLFLNAGLEATAIEEGIKEFKLYNSL